MGYRDLKYQRESHFLSKHQQLNFSMEIQLCHDIDRFDLSLGYHLHDPHQSRGRLRLLFLGRQIQLDYLLFLTRRICCGNFNNIYSEKCCPIIAWYILAFLHFLFISYSLSARVVTIIFPF